MVTSRRHPNQRERSTLPPELRRTTVPPAVRAWVARRVGAAVVRARRLPGASSTAVHDLRLSDGRRLVLRRYVWPGFLDEEPEASGREVDALRFAAAAGLPVPEVVAADVTGEEVGDGVAVLLMTFVPGRAVAVPDLTALADVAAAIHAVDPAGFGHDYFPWYQGTTSEPPAAATRPEVWAAAIDLWLAGAPPYRPTFVHRDFHPGNVLWRRGRLCGVVDWTSACRGPAGCDVAHCRTNLVELAGCDAADRFLAAYRSLTGEDHHPWWELASVLEHDPRDWTPERVAATEPHLARVLAELTPAPRRR